MGCLFLQLHIAYTAVCSMLPWSGNNSPAACYESISRSTRLIDSLISCCWSWIYSDNTRNCVGCRSAKSAFMETRAVWPMLARENIVRIPLRSYEATTAAIRHSRLPITLSYREQPFSPILDTEHATVHDHNNDETEAMICYYGLRIVFAAKKPLTFYCYRPSNQF